MRIIYESPDIEIFKFTLNTAVLTASNNNESSIEEGSHFTFEEDDDFDPFG